MAHSIVRSTAVAGATLAIGLSAAVRPARAQHELHDRHVYVSVVDKQGAPVPGLTEADFGVKEDGLTREILHVAPATEPMQVAVLVDTSAYTQFIVQELRKSTASLIHLVLDVSPSTEMALYTFGERPTRQVDFTSSPVALLRAANGIFPISDAGAFLHDAISDACAALRKRHATRPVIVAFTSEDSPEFSTIDHERVAEIVQAAHAALWVVVLQGHGRSNFSSSHEIYERTRVISDVTAESGGDNLPVISSAALGRAFGQVAARLADEYDITYSRSEDLVPPKHLEVTLKRPDLHLSAPKWPGA